MPGSEQPIAVFEACEPAFPMPQYPTPGVLKPESGAYPSGPRERIANPSFVGSNPTAPFASSGGGSAITTNLILVPPAARITGLVIGCASARPAEVTCGF